MSLFFIVIFCSVFLFIAIDTVVRYWKIPILASLPVAFASIVAFETVFLNILSWFNSVQIVPVLSVHLLAIVVWGAVHIREYKIRGCLNFWRYFFALKRIICIRPLYAVIPLLVILLFVAILYPPNNYDSMSYHMARVAHWIQLQSVDYYPTPINRQNLMGPGAEYLILIPQLLGQTDVLANSLQFISYVILISSVLYILRMLRVSRGLAPFILILTITAPMAVMQATSTQNDLVATVMTYAIIIASRRFFMGSFQKFLYRDYALIGLCIAAGFLVKPTSLLAASPFFVIGFFCQFHQIIKIQKNIKNCLIGGGIIIFSVCIIAGPDIQRKKSSHFTRPEVFKIFSGWDSTRWQNPIAMAGHNIATPLQPSKILSKIGYNGPFNTTKVLTIHEDLIGNPLQMLALCVLFAGTLFTLPFIHSKKMLIAFFLSICPLGAWVVFGLTVKDQLWITRLQLPLFYLLPFAFVYLSVISCKSKLFYYGFKTITVSSAYIALTYAMIVACNNPHRPIKLVHFFGELPDRTWSYYNNALHEDRVSHQALLDTALNQGCAKVGLLMEGNSNDYPLTWRLMQEGRETRHVTMAAQLEDMEWPCIYYVEEGEEHRLPHNGLHWLSIEGNVFTRDLEWKFDHSTQTCLELNFIDESNVQLGVSDDVQLEPGLDGVLVRGTSEDPQIILPEVDCSSGNWGVLKVVIVSSVSTTAQMYYKTIKQPYFNEFQSVKQKIHVGENILFFQIPVSDLIESIRLDPGQIPGEYKVKKIIIRT